ncbi:conserved hypothetical protein [Burkholderia sp. 8Y]|uniref:hypothetical protein n=1 Tax=Burkholderia sp. 8Y TaxID=2653133 RepID=UPI0012F0211F|nr:hypothetical protein [Burkholderia sp. 8Y]VXC31557.1 conserved hypothetical protein [Burkholderia sp. 8Y]
MTEPLIAIEGKLRLPPLRPLADPSLTFGREWSAVSTRPVRSDSEMPISAARFETAYVEATGLSDARSPYRAASLWGVFSEDQIRRKMLQLMQSAESAAAPAKDAQGGAAPISIAVSAPAVGQDGSDRPVRAGAGHKPLRTAIALACAALIAWLLFGYQHRPASEEPAAALPAAMAGTTPIVAQGASGVEAKVAAVGVQSESVSSEQSASLASAKVARDASHVGPQQAASSDQPASLPSTKAARTASRVDTTATTDRLAPQPTAISPTVRHARMKPRSETSVAETVARAKASRGHAHARALASAAQGKRASHMAASHGRQTIARYAEPRANTSASAMNVEALYAVLQHSPTLDSNAAPQPTHRPADAPSN